MVHSNVSSQNDNPVSLMKLLLGAVGVVRRATVHQGTQANRLRQVTAAEVTQLSYLISRLPRILGDHTRARRTERYRPPATAPLSATA
jgi:hypothetical protein